MEIEIKKVVEVNAKCLHVEAGVRYWEDAEVDGVVDITGEIPCRVCDMWMPIIDIDSGVIINWEQGKKADIHYKVCDAGIYTLTDDLGNDIIKKDGYVPDILSPGGSGYGDYIIMKVDESGKIEDWQKNLIRDFVEDEED